MKLEKKVRKFFLGIYQWEVIKKYGYKKKQNEEKITMYMNNKSASMIIYDKEERKSKNMKIKKEEKNVLRFQVAVKVNHLNYQKRKGFIKDLSNYFHESMRKSYFKNNFNKILYEGDYYKIYEARKILKIDVQNEKFRQTIVSS